MISVNGKKLNLNSASLTIKQLLKMVKDNREVVAHSGNYLFVKLNGNVVSLNKYDYTYVKHGDEISVFPLSGGG